ncbi:MAG: DUF2793 domain-containing protein [Rhizobiales bacterium]|nr:DUF2793 domain-containing protein [Hyphomicrobiales bacterium]
MTDVSDTSPNLSLPFYQTKQNEFEVQHNEALMVLDALAMLSVIDRDLTEPPVSPAQGDRYLVKAPGAGDFIGRDNCVAQYDVGGWNFYPPRVGWTCYVQDERTLLAWDGSAWQSALDIAGGGGASELQNMTLLGIGTEADEVNPLAAKLNNVLWTARTEAEGGDGTLRYKMSKESADKTLSLLFQNNYSGRAEIGLAGDDDFHFKVSDDGTNWLEAIRIDRATGRVVFPVWGGPREILAADRVYYVRTDGSDDNTGLSNTSGGAFLTIQRAINVAVALDLSIYGVTIQVADGTYTSPVVLKSYVGAGPIIIQGNNAAPQNVVISTTSTNAVRSMSCGSWTLRDLKIQTTTSGLGCEVQDSYLTLTRVHFGAVADYGVRAMLGGKVNINGGYTISGGGFTHLRAELGGLFTFNSGLTTVLSGTPAFAIFAVALSGGVINCPGMTYSGSGVGQRFSTSNGGAILTNGGGANYFPGNAAGAGTNYGASPYGLYQ